MFGVFGMMVGVTIILLCCKVDLEKNNKRMEKVRKKNAIQMHGEVNVVAVEDFKKPPLEPTVSRNQDVTVTVLPEPENVQNVPSERNENVVDNSETVENRTVATHNNGDRVRIESEHHEPQNGDLDIESVHVEVNHEQRDLQENEPPKIIVGELKDEDTVASVQSNDDNGIRTKGDGSASENSGDIDEPAELKLDQRGSESDSVTGSERQRDDAMQLEEHVVAMVDESCDLVDEEAITQL
jgi:hypothetical protein